VKLAAPLLASLVLAGVLAGSAPTAVHGRLAGATTFRVCGAAGPYWPTQTLALDGDSAWIACKEQSRVIRLDTKTGKVRASLRLPSAVSAVAVGYRSLWALSGSTLVRIRPATAKVAARVPLPTSAPYNIWIGGGSVWVVDDAAGRLLRVSPATNRLVAEPQVGDGAADMVFSGGSGWAINHRDRGLVRVDLATNAVTRLATIPGDAPERMALLGGSLWITGRGTDLLQVDPATGAVRSTVEIGASGIDVVAGANALWVPTRSAAVDPTGFPTMLALRKVVAATGAVTTRATSVGRIDVHGLQYRAGRVWLADNRTGTLFRLTG
jgi:hypothetical protein